MRFKVECLDPALRVWHAPDEQRCTTIAHLKRVLAADILQTSSPLQLSLDGFDLLDSSLLSNVLRDGDLVVVKVSPSPVGTKRKRSPSLSSSSSSSSDADSSESSSESSSDSSESSSESSSDSDSSEEAAPPAPRRQQPQVASRQLVPPGQGKPSTHSRNARRKAKAAALKNPPLPPFLSATNATITTSLNEPARVLHMHPLPQSEAEETLKVQMMSMLPKSKNKNKSRRGLDSSNAPARKIVFEAPPFADAETSQAGRVALVPPSSLSPDAIPANVFITSIDVEEGVKRRKKPQRMRDPQPEPQPETVLEYGLPELDWDSALPLDSQTQLLKGQVIGFSGLIIDPITFTPGFGMRYGRILGWTDELLTLTRLVEGASGLEDMEEEELDWSEARGQWRIMRVE